MTHFLDRRTQLVRPWVDHILRRNCLLKHFIEGKIEVRIEVTGRGGRRRKQLLHDLKEKGGCLKQRDETLDRILCRNYTGSGYGPIIRQAK